ncbi:ABC transporter substrate-binding protein [Bacillus carboniphilus]|uniref:ABC transporter substrate-binding protein n=1 Tax=Bacillus carboniphilus TaxID=86663 RepID=A0ABN0VRY8_9BACI
MKWKKLTSIALASVLSVSALAACSTGNNNNEETSQDGVTTIEFWAAPNPPQQKFWQQMADEFNGSQEDIKVEVSTIKESPTSEASIQSALAGKSAPTISENINRGFAAQLADSKALVPLNEIEGWDELIEGRQMTDTVSAWKFSDGNQYVLPIYSNPMLFGWRLDILNELGFEEAPRTYSEVFEVVDALKEKYPDKYLWAKPDLGDPTAWKRWFDFFMLYNGASEGNNFIEGADFVADEDAAKDVFGFFAELEERDAILLNQSTDPFESALGIFTDIGPWTFNYWAEKFPHMVYGETFTLAPPPVPDGTSTENVKTFADAKGLVIFAQAPKAEQEAAMEFLTWVFSNPENDVAWLEQTNLPPARDDMATNELFTSFLEANPAVAPYAAAIPNGIPSIDNPKYNELQTYIGQYAVNPLVKGETNPDEAWEKMKQAIEGELK